MAGAQEEINSFRMDCGINTKPFKSKDKNIILRATDSFRLGPEQETFVTSVISTVFRNIEEDQ